MATSLLALLDDVATILDDVAVHTKVAAVKTSGVVGDDLAVTADRVAGVNADRELPIIWAVAKGSMLNKLWQVPSALILSAFAAFVIPFLLCLGGLYLCYEGAEKVLEKVMKMMGKFHEEKTEDTSSEKEKIKGAIKTDIVLSGEIIIIALGTITTLSLAMQSVVLSLLAIGMTVLVYGFVGVIIKVDDFGLYLLKKESNTMKLIGNALINSMPVFMKLLTVVGTLAMFSVGGGILAHNIDFIKHIGHNFTGLTAFLFEMGTGLVVGAITVAIMELIHKIKK